MSEKAKAIDSGQIENCNILFVGKVSFPKYSMHESGGQHLFFKITQLYGSFFGISPQTNVKKFRIVKNVFLQSTFIKQMKILHSEEKEKVCHPNITRILISCQHFEYFCSFPSKPYSRLDTFSLNIIFALKFLGVDPRGT